jgi:hypothetical protein
MIYTLALRCNYIRYHRRKLPVKRKPGTYMTKDLDYLMYRKAHTSPFDVRQDSKKIYWLSELLSLSLVGRQVRAETKLLVWQVNVFHVCAQTYTIMMATKHWHTPASQISIQDLPDLVKALPTEVTCCIKRLGILNNVHLTENHNLPNLTALKAFPALGEVEFVQMAGCKDEYWCYELYEVAVAIAGLTGREYKFIRDWVRLIWSTSIVAYRAPGGSGDW